jgi:hypothetical protein
MMMMRGLDPTKGNQIRGLSYFVLLGVESLEPVTLNSGATDGRQTRSYCAKIPG